MMHLAKLSALKSIFNLSTSRRLASVTVLHHHHLTHPQPEVQQPDTEQNEVVSKQSLIDSVYSIISHPIFDSSQSKRILLHLSPYDFDNCFLSIVANTNIEKLNPKTALEFFQFASVNCKFHFTVRSYCLLIGLLVSCDELTSARSVLVELVGGKLPALYENSFCKRHFELGLILANLNSISELDVVVRVVDILIHVYSTDFKHLGFGVTVELFTLLGNKGLLPSLKSCNILLNSLVKAKKLNLSYEVFDIMCQCCSALDVYSFSTMVNAFCIGGRVDDAVGLFRKMEELGVAPNVVTYTNIIHGLCKVGRLDEAFQFKEKMVSLEVEPNLVTYSVLINGLVKLERFDEANCILKEISDRGLTPNNIVYNTLLDGYCKADKVEECEKLFAEMVSMEIELDSVVFNILIRAHCKKGNMTEAFRLRDDMRSRGIPRTSFTYSTLIHGLCNIGLVDDANQLLDEMRNEGLSPNVVCYNALIGGYCKLGKMHEADSVLQNMSLKNARPNKVTYTTIINGYCKLGNVEEADKLLNEMAQKGIILDAATDNAFRNGFCKEEKVEEALQI
ncbi:pentatricopeptide repeat-containing protein At4g19440, chloroplastic-like [Mercurialis annua]|uniref:pentatricopeptide repeat-containing protein At4g19440, chloroplastic-like n=1 Tax=Mercurialis annua TaxID=3986 RepID=UPI00215EDF54|nr:pentatricopeptide repeat-containing protein At4g19440, chloroplastic-like [Mercurialis annua]